MGDGPDKALLGNKIEGFSTKRKLILVVAVVVVVSVVVVGVSLALYYQSSDSDDKKVDISASLSLENIVGHLANFNDLANKLGNGSRSVVDAYNASAEYVVQRLQETGFCDVQRQYFTVPIYLQLAPPTLFQTALNFSYVLGRDFSGTRYGGNGTYDVEKPSYVADNYGCNFPDDFQGADFVGNIAVVFDGGCTQYAKALNAEKANASAILIVNARGNALSNWRVRSVTWNSTDPLVQIPVLGLTYSLGLTLKAQPGTVLRLTTSSQVTIETTYNVLCLTKKGSEESILVAGAHLDSVPEGPGINDDGSGSATVLEVALEAERSGLELKSKIIFAWWGAEEIGLLGSRYFVNSLVAQSQPGAAAPFSQEDFLPSLSSNNTWLNLNFDMLASPNFVRYVYTSISSTPAVNNASSRIQTLFEDFFKQRNASYQIAPMSGGSDYLPFIENGFPAGALATGAGGLKTEAERQVYGGFANAAYDTCYHLSCDTTWNIDKGVLQEMSKAAAYVVQKLAEQSHLRPFLYE